MNQTTKIEAPPNGLELLRQPFPANQISKLPKESRKQIDERKNDRSKVVFGCKVCGGIHHKDAVHLDYVGHAALTDRLLDADIEWEWEPLAFNEMGLPALDPVFGGLWIKLTVCGKTRLGYGDAAGKTGGDAMKEMIGDAMRNAAMRFGAALDLWHKGDLHVDTNEAEPAKEVHKDDEPKGDYAFPDGPATGITQLKNMARQLWREVEGCGDDDELICLLEMPENKALTKQLDGLEHPEHRKVWEGDGEDNIGLYGLIQRKRAQFKAELLRA